MISMQFAGLTMYAPEGWKDESTIVLTKPSSVGDPRLSALAQESVRHEASLTVKWEMMPANTTLEGYLNANLDSLRRTLPGLQVIESGNTIEGATDAAFLELELEQPLPLRQIILVRQVGDRVVIVTGSALPGNYLKLKKLFVETSASITAA